MAKAQHVEGRKLSALATINPTQFRTRVRRALLDNGGVVMRAAKDLRIGHRQLWRWIKRDPTLLEGVEHKGNPAKALAISA